MRVMVTDPEAMRGAATVAAVAEGVFYARDLVNAPANILTTTEFARRLEEMSELGLEVEVLDEDALAGVGMRTLLAVGQGSADPSKVVVMRWNGGAEGAAPLALIGKGVVFDTGGISLKPAAGMEDMTMDMGGAGTVAGVMRTLARRRAKANVVGLVGLVENMPGPEATRPGNVVTSMKGDTVEVINTDAEGRMVLCDVMWYAQERFKPRGMIDLATLTGAIVVGLGHENAGVFSNDDAFCNSLAAARAEGEGAWRMPLGKGYAQAAEVAHRGCQERRRPSRGGIAAAIPAPLREGPLPSIHLDIAGVASLSSDSDFAQGCDGLGRAGAGQAGARHAGIVIGCGSGTGDRHAHRRDALPDCEAALAFLTEALGLAEHAVYRDEAGGIVHAELRLGTGIFMFGPDDAQGAFGRYMIAPSDTGGPAVGIDLCRDARRRGVPRQGARRRPGRRCSCRRRPSLKGAPASPSGIRVGMSGRWATATRCRADDWAPSTTSCRSGPSMPSCRSCCRGRGTRGGACWCAGPTQPLDALDLALWDGAPEAFLPHGLAGGPHDDAQPILLGTGTPAAGFDCVMTVDGADLSPEEAAELQRACVIFGDEGLAQARGLWRALAGAGCAAQFWPRTPGAGRRRPKARAPSWFEDQPVVRDLDPAEMLRIS